LKMLQASAEIVRKLGVDMVPTFLGAHAVSPEFENAKDYTSHIFEDMLPAVADAGIARCCNMFCEKGVGRRAIEAHHSGCQEAGLRVERFTRTKSSRSAGRSWLPRSGPSLRTA
jgi:imidazolonepropionase-like amidohydrolase